MDQDTGEPLDTLSPLAKAAIEQLGSRCTTVSGVIDSKDRAVFSAISEGLERANKHAISNAQKVVVLQKKTVLCNFFLKHRFKSGVSWMLTSPFQVEN